MAERKTIKKKGDKDLSDYSMRLFDYKKLFGQIKKEYRKNQKDISQILDCSEVHVSNVKNEKKGFTTEEIIQLMNEFQLCPDDYVCTGWEKGEKAVYEGMWMQEDMDAREKVFMLRIMQNMKSYLKAEYEEKEEENIKVCIGKNIRNLREKQKITQEEMAQYLNMQKKSYQNIENGNRGTGIDTYILISKKLKVPLGKMFSGVLRNKKTEILYDTNELMSELNPRQKRKMIEAALLFQEILHEEKIF